jgi:hypothetical protein
LLSADEVRALKFAAHRQLARWAGRPRLQPRDQERRDALARAVRVLEDKALRRGCELRAADDPP